MAGNKAASKKRRATMIKKYGGGSEKKYLEFMRRNASLGGKATQGRRNA